MKKGNIFIILVFIFLYLPIAVLIAYSFNSSSSNIIFEHFTLSWYKELFNNRELIESFMNTIIVTVVSTVVSTIIGTISAIGLSKYDFKLKNFINKLIYIPIVIPEIVLGISLLSVYTLAKFDLSLYTIILSHIAFSIPFVLVSVRGSISKSLKSCEEAAKDLGASDFLIFRKITLPNIMPGIISGATLAITLSLDDVVISYFTAGPGSNTLPLYIYSIIKTGITPDVNALSSLLLLGAIIFLTFNAYRQSKKIARSNI